MTYPAASDEASFDPRSQLDTSFETAVNVETPFAAAIASPPPTVRSPRDFARYVGWLQQRAHRSPITPPEAPDASAPTTGPLDSDQLAEFRQAGGMLRFDDHYFRVSGHLFPAPSEQMEEASRPADQPNPVMPLAGENRPAIARLANWEVPDFQWPDAIETTMYREPHIADAILNQCTRFVRPREQRLAIAGHKRRQGTTFIAAALARWAAHNGRRVLIVDADLTNPHLAASLGLEESSDISWERAFRNGEPIADAMIQSSRTGVCLIPLVPSERKRPGPRARLDALGELLNPIRNQFDLILIDVGSANQLMNSLTHPLRLVDTALLVHNGGEPGHTRPGSTLARLRAFGIPSLVDLENPATGRSRSAAT